MKYQIREEVGAWTNWCEYLLTTELTLTEDERGLLDYYVKEVTRKLLSAGNTNPHPVALPSAHLAAPKSPPRA